MKKRLDYDYVDGEYRIAPELGIPQGGIDSPVLFNIYMLDLDNYVMNDLHQYLNDLNKKKGIKENEHGKICKTRRRLSCLSCLSYKVLVLTKELKKRKQEFSNPTGFYKPSTKIGDIYAIIREIRITRHMRRRMPSFDSNKIRLRLYYTRYADDWIMLTNCDNQIAEVLKGKIAAFLKTNLGLSLSENKTMITDIRKEPAHFLGFVLKRAIRSRLVYLRKGSRIILSHSGGLPVKASPDRVRLINRMHLKGYCDKRGFPRELPWLSGLHTHIIIERYNSVLRGTSQYYVEWIREPSRINRWIYILRYSCFKTIAKKYDIYIRKVFAKFGVHLNNTARKTVECTVTQTHQGETFSKSWRLLTYQELLTFNLKQEKSRIFSPLYPRGIKYSSFLVRANDPLRGSSLPPFGAIRSDGRKNPSAY